MTTNGYALVRELPDMDYDDAVAGLLASAHAPRHLPYLLHVGDGAAPVFLHYECHADDEATTPVLKCREA